MKEGTTKYVIDSRFFRGSCVTMMSDGVHCDYFGNTLEELRGKEGNPYLVALSIKALRKHLRIYSESLCGPFKEVDEWRYNSQLRELPPIRRNRNSFFMGEPYRGNIHSFYFKAGNRYFTGLRPVDTPHAELQRQIGEHYFHISRKPGIEKWAVSSSQGDKSLGWAYFFPSDRKRLLFICNLYNPADKESHVRENDYTLLAGKAFFQYPVSRESATFVGSVKETGEKFLYRIYDKGIFLHLLKCLRSVKRETISKKQ